MKKWSFNLLLLPILLAAACQQQQQLHTAAEEEPEAPKTPPPLHLGAVHQVYPEQQFALLRIIGPMPGPGVTLITHPADGSTDRIGNLVISAGQPTRNNIIAADIRSGTVVKGDRVFRYRNIAGHEGKEQITEAAEPEETPAIAAPSEPDSTPVPAPVTVESDEDFPEPQVHHAEDDNDDTTVETPPPPMAPTSVTPTPSYLNDIPDNINDWD